MATRGGKQRIRPGADTDSFGGSDALQVLHAGTVRRQIYDLLQLPRKTVGDFHIRDTDQAIPAAYPYRIPAFFQTRTCHRAARPASCQQKDNT